MAIFNFQLAIKISKENCNFGFMRIPLIGAAVVALFFISAFVSDYTSAQFPGGKAAMEKFLRDSLRYPDVEGTNGNEAIVNVRFDISKTGVVTSPTTKMIVGGSENFRMEAERLVTSMPTWEPAKGKLGRPTDDWETVLIRFELPDSLAKLPPPSEDTTVYVELDTMAQFPGGPPSMFYYIFYTVRYPQMEMEENKEGTVYVGYTVERNGKLSNVYAHKEVPGAPGLTKEAIRVISSFPRQKPGIKNGKAVRCKIIIPVKFILN